jgi:hypothetical protein
LPNAAPVGVRRKEEQLIIDLAEGTTSLENLRLENEGSLCIVYDPLLIAQAAFNELPSEAFQKMGAHESAGIIGSSAIVGIRVRSETPTAREDELGRSVFARLALEATFVTVTGCPIPLSRGVAAATEAIVAVTKAEVAVRRGLLQLLPKYEEAVRRCLGVAERAGKDPSIEAAFDLCEKRMKELLLKGER